MRRNVDYRADLLADIRSSTEFAAEYLNAAMADSKEAFLVALRDVSEAKPGMKDLARKANLNRESLYRSLSRRGNPSLGTVDAVLNALGLEIRFSAKESGARKRKRKAAA